MAGHWYNQQGEPVHFQPNGKDTTLREARKEGLLPGFSGVTSILAKPGLDIWKENQTLEAAWSAEIPPNEHGADDYEGWKANIKRLAKERSLKARDRGSQIHDYIERFIKQGANDTDPTDDMMKYVEAVQIAIKDELGLDIRTLEAETTFASTLGYGGMIDATDRSVPILIDWKTKDKEWDEKTKLAYDDHGMQLAAYREGAGLCNARCVNVFISPSAKIKIHVWSESELVRLFDKFKACLKLWQLDRKYDSSSD